MNKFRPNEIDPRLASLLDELKPAPKRDPQLAVRGRAHFLAEAVSVRNERRLSLWTTIFQQKEQFAMKLIMSMLVIAGLLFGGNATVSAAQDDLPNEPLYPIKLMREEMNLWLISDPVAQIEMLMEQAQTRTEETAALAEEGITPPAELSVRAQKRIQRALQLAAGLDDPTTTLEQIRTQLQTQEQLMSRLQDGTCLQCEPVLQQTREMLQTQLRQMESGIDHPQTSPNQNQNQNQNQIRTTQTPSATDETAIPGVSCTPALDGTGQQNGGGNPSAGTPMPQDNSTNQGGGDMQNGSDNGGSNQSGNNNGNGNGSGDESGSGNGSSDDAGQGSGGQGGKP